MRVELNINGIFTLPGSSNAWTNAAVTLAHTEHRIFAEKVENLTGALTRPLTQECYARWIAAKALRYVSRGWHVTLRGHSNGAALAIRAAEHLPRTAGVTLHLIAGACINDWRKNALTTLMREGVVRRVHCCVSRRDRALLIALVTSPILRVLRNAYGWLGLLGPTHVPDDLMHRVLVTRDDQMRHGDWVARSHLKLTLEDFYAEEGLL